MKGLSPTSDFREWSLTIKCSLVSYPGHPLEGGSLIHLQMKSGHKMNRGYSVKTWILTTSIEMRSIVRINPCNNRYLREF